MHILRTPESMLSAETSPWAFCASFDYTLINPLTPILGGQEVTQRGFAPLHAPIGGAHHCRADRAERNPPPLSRRMGRAHHETCHSHGACPREDGERESRKGGDMTRARTNKGIMSMSASLRVGNHPYRDCPLLKMHHLAALGSGACCGRAEMLAL